MNAAWLKSWGQRFGSIRLEGHKELSNQQQARHIKASAGMTLVIPLQQHMGAKPELCVNVGDYVYKGQTLADAEDSGSVPVHTSTSGTISAIEKRPIPHPSGLHDTCVILEADGLDASAGSYLPAMPDYQQQDSHTLRQRIHDAGIVGLGGAVFPSAIKLRVHPQIPIDTLVINGVECEPYITCDEVLMRDKAAEILSGIQIMLHILESDEDSRQVRCLIGIEDNKAQAVQLMRDALAELADPRIEIVIVPTQYPAGGEKQLIHVLTGKEVPSGGRPADIGIICHNVATAQAIYRAVVFGKPLISRYVTVTGDGVKQPGNVEVPLGILMGDLVAAMGEYSSLPFPSYSPAGGAGSTGKEGLTKYSSLLTMGGPMMGISLTTDQIPVVKATNCILVKTDEPKPETPLPCIRCGKCADHCPAGLLPQQLYWYSKAKDFAKAEDYRLFDCIECGCCDYVCPSHIPLVDYYRFAKTEVRAQRVAKDKAELARERHDFHNERLERAKRERAERLAKHKKKATATGDKKDAIQAALERAKAKKAQRTQNSDTPVAPNERRHRRQRTNVKPNNDTLPPTDKQEPQA